MPDLPGILTDYQVIEMVTLFLAMLVPVAVLRSSYHRGVPDAVHGEAGANGIGAAEQFKNQGRLAGGSSSIHSRRRLSHATPPC